MRQLMGRRGFRLGRKDPYDTSKVLHIKTQPNWFNKDNSSNNSSLTVNGNARPSIKSPFTGYEGSTFFDGTNSYLFSSFNNTLFGLPGDFTVEAWIYFNGSVPVNDYKQIISHGNSGTTQRWILYYDSRTSQATPGLRFVFVNSSGAVSLDLQQGNTTGWAANTWYHVAVTRSGNTFRLFRNGVQLNTLTSSATTINPTAGGLYIGSEVGGAAAFWNGYIADVAIHNTAKYTNAFTPYSAPLTTTSATTLLTCQSRYTQNNNSFLDSSSNDFTITRNGNTTQGSYGPFTDVSEIYFDGTGDYLDFALDNNTRLGSGNWTIRTRIYITSLSSGRVIYSTRSGVNYTGIIVGVRSNGQIYLLFTNNGTTWAIDTYTTGSGSSIIINTWYDITVVRNGDTISNYINGVLNYTSAFTGTVNETNTIAYIGYDPGITTNGFNGYIAGFEINSTALYTSNFTPPVTYPTIATTRLNLAIRKVNSYNNNCFVDSSPNSFPITRNGNVTQGNYGITRDVSEIYFDGTGDYLAFPLDTNNKLSSGDFTIRARIYITSLAANRIIYSNRTGNNFTGIFLGVLTTGKIFLAFSNNGSTWAVDTTAGTGSSLSINTWYDITIIRSGNTISNYINGVLNYTNTFTGTVNETGTIGYIGYELGAFASPFLGYISAFEINGTALYTANFTPPTTYPTVASSKLNLAIKTNSSNNNNVFTDSSSNSFTITRNGNVTQGTFGPAAGINSSYFDGTGDYLQIPTSPVFNFGSGNFTVEGWFYLTSLPSAYKRIFNISHSTSANVSGNEGILIEITNTNTLAAAIQSSTVFYSVATSFSLSPNVWYQYALVRNGTTLTLYLNGINVAAATCGTVSVNFTTNYAPLVGKWYIGESTRDFLGYQSLLRVSNIARYTTNFTPSTNYTSDANTSLFLNFNNYSIYDLTNKYNIETVGDVKTSSLQLSIPSGLSSGYFDGTGDFLTTPSSSLFNFGTGNFTIEFWVNTSNTTNCDIFGYYNGANTGFGVYIGNPYNLSLLPGTVTVSTEPSGVDYLNAPTNTILTNSWYHVAAVKNGSSITIYVNGINVASKTTSVSWGVTQSMGIGKLNGSLNRNLNGYLSLLRVSNTARYTSNFTPSTNYTSDSNSILFLEFKNAAIVDSTNKNALETVGDARTSSFQLPTPKDVFSGYFDGTGDYLSLPISSLLNLNNSNFTYEVYFNVTGSGVSCSLLHLKNASTNGGLHIWRNSSGQIVLDDGINTQTAIPFVTSNNTWYHLAVVRNGTLCTAFINGVSIGSLTLNPTASDRGFIGIFGTTTSPYFGYMAYARLSNIARYTTNFTPTTTYTVDSNTILFLPFNNAAVYDATGKNNIETVGGVNTSDTATFMGNPTVYTNGSTGYLTLPYTSNFTFGTGAFTIDGWFKLFSIPGSTAYPGLIARNFTGIQSTIAWSLAINPFGNGLGFNVSNGTAWLSPGPQGSTPTFNTSTWYYFQLIADGTTRKLYVNGVLTATSTSNPSTETNAGSNTTPLYIGTQGSGAYLNAYLSDIRITKGIARPASTPTAPFPTT